MEEPVDLVVVGAGPAGLAAGTTAVEIGASCIVLEGGQPSRVRDRRLAADLVTGVGGAGLYSDGKFSFAPSATALWGLEPETGLREAYGWTVSVLRDHGVDSPPFPDRAGLVARSGGPLKAYPSQYMPLEQRLALIASLEAGLGDRLRTGVDGRVSAGPDGVVVRGPWGRGRARAGVVATGRFGGLQVIDGAEARFRRVEIGMRVEQPAGRFALDEEPVAAALLDPKWVQRSGDGRYEWRTFCCCRGGEVVQTRFGDLVTVSGRADGDPTERSNFGLNVRFLDRKEGEVALAQAIEAARRPAVRIRGFELLGSTGLEAVGSAVGREFASALREGLIALGAYLRQDFGEAILHMPAIEGVGYYPAVDDTLRVRPALWAAGDATGIFRGLVPALVSGRMAATSALAAVDER